MRRKLVLVGPEGEPGTAEEIITFAAARGYVVVDDQLVRLGNEDLDNWVATHTRMSAAEKALLVENGVSTLRNLTSLSASEVWRRVGTYKQAAEKRRRKRLANDLFMRICEIMMKRKFRFSDCDPARFNCLTSDGWEVRFHFSLYGTDGRKAVRTLLEHGIIAPQVLAGIEDGELKLLEGAGTATVQLLIRARNSV